MAPLYEYLCRECSHQFETLAPKHVDPDFDTTVCEHCDSSRVERLPSAHAGYYIRGDNSASVRPKGAGSRSRK